MVDLLWEKMRRRIARLVRIILRDERCYNRDILADGVVKQVSADGKRADVYLNGADKANPPGAATPGIGNPNGLPLVTGDQIKVLMADPRDPVILYKKIL